MNGALVFAVLATVVLLGILAVMTHTRLNSTIHARDTTSLLVAKRAVSALRRPQNVLVVTVCPQGTKPAQIKRAPIPTNVMYTSDRELASAARPLGWQVVVTPYPIEQRHVLRYAQAPFKLFEVGLRFSGAIVLFAPHAEVDVKALLQAAVKQPDKVTRLAKSAQVVWFETPEQRRNALSDHPEVALV